MKKLMLVLATVMALAGCGAADTTTPTVNKVNAASESTSQVVINDSGHTDEKVDVKQTYTKVHIFNGSLGGKCVRIKDWDWVQDGSGIKVWFSDDSIYKDGIAFMSQGTYMLIYGPCPICD